MSSTFKLHSNINEVVPWNVMYSFPTQSTKIAKQTVKLIPKNGQTFYKNNTIRIEFPAENYLNVLNSTLAFDVTLTAPTPTATAALTNVTATNFKPRQWTLDLTASTGSWIITGNALKTNDLVYLPCVLTCIGTAKDKGTYYNVIVKHVATSATTQYLTFLYDWPVTPVATDTFAVYPNTSWQRGGAHNLFNRVTVKYGSLTIEDIQEYARLVRLFYEIGVQKDYSGSHGQIVDGMASTSTNDSIGGNVPGDISDCFVDAVTDATAFTSADAYIAPEAAVAATMLYPGRRRTFNINLMTGLFTQKKLIPLKWLASQLVIEATVANEGDALVQFSGCLNGSRQASTTVPTYTIEEVRYIAELLEFDSAFDSSFYAGLQTTGIPLKFGSWHYHAFPITGVSSVFQIHERSRSVKSAFAAIVTNKDGNHLIDRNRFYHDLNLDPDTSSGLTTWDANGAAAPIEEFWWRIGGRYYPSQPIRALYGASEAFLELSKAVDNLGDYTKGSQITAQRWAGSYNPSATYMTEREHGGQTFIMACGFENVDVMPGTIAGINAEEQSDIALSIKIRRGGVVQNKNLAIMMYYDCVMVCQSGNNIVLIM